MVEIAVVICLFFVLVYPMNMEFFNLTKKKKKKRGRERKEKKRKEIVVLIWQNNKIICGTGGLPHPIP